MQKRNDSYLISQQLLYHRRTLFSHFNGKTKLVNNDCNKKAPFLAIIDHYAIKLTKINSHVSEPNYICTRLVRSL